MVPACHAEMIVAENNWDAVQAISQHTPYGLLAKQFFPKWFHGSTY
jgi:hypothetical protein